MALVWTVFTACLVPSAALARDHAAASDSTPQCGAPEPMIAGLLACTAELQARWPRSDAWLLPVGDSLCFGRDQVDEPGYRINRSVFARDAKVAGHDGDDLANGRAGGWVRAAASGVVVAAEPSGGGGYGNFIVIAHHLDHVGLAYTVYAHLLAESARVSAGAAVRAGDYLGQVGQTGRATTPHLHFEVRVPRDSTLRWERCAVVDPLAFISARQPEGSAAPHTPTPQSQRAHTTKRAHAKRHPRRHGHHTGAPLGAAHVGR